MRLIVQTALGLALVFTLSCSSDKDDDSPGTGGSGGSTSGGGSCDISGYRKVPMPDGKTWMAENLNCDVAGSVCYDKDPANCATYGRLYNWAAAKTVCPSPWRLPSDAEWEALVTAVGYDSGTKLKADSPLWSNGKGTDEFGFSALPGSRGNSDGSFGFVGVGYFGYWWSATEFDASIAYGRSVYFNYSEVVRDYSDKASFISVRCVQD